jgi:hypothetical protein
VEIQGFKPPERRALRFSREKGKIYRFDPERIEVIRLGKPYPAAFVKTAGGKGWRNWIPTTGFPFLFPKPCPYDLEGASEALKKYLALQQNLYAEIAAHVGGEKVGLLERYDRRSWFLHCLLENGGDYALDLMRSNPALAYLLSAHGVFRTLKSRRYLPSVRSLLRKRRREILGYFGFPKSEAAVRLFARISPGACNNELLFILRKKLRESPELLRQLSFFGSHSATSLRLICSRLRPHFDYHALNELAAPDLPGGEETVREKLWDILRMRSALDRQGMPQPRFYVRSLSDLDTIHDELVEGMNRVIRVHDHQYEGLTLPEVRLGHVWIENIHLASELHREGCDMHHCIFSYHEEISQGDCFAARMLAPERLTILYRERGLGEDGNPEYELVDARGLRNAAPQPGSLNLIRQWLQRIDLDYYNPDQLTIFGVIGLEELLTESG